MLLPYQQRVIEEKSELDDKLEKLQAFLESAGFEDNLDLLNRQLLLQQFAFMLNYSAVLSRRIETFQQITKE